MISKTASGLTAVDTISYATGESALGTVLVARSASGVCAILIGADNDELVADLATRFPRAKLVAIEDARPRRSGEGHPLRGQA